MKQQEPKKWFKKCIVSLIAILVLIAGVMVVVDPYFHFHKPLSILSYRLNEERYINDGIARHFDYDAIITGTSMTQNFKTSEMDALFGTRSIKAPFSGAGYQELSENLERALKRNDNLKTILLGLDYNGLLREYDWKRYESYPTYLYDDNPFNDASYVFNKSILYHGVMPNLVMTLKGQTGTTMDDYSTWQYETGLQSIMGSYTREDVVPLEENGFGEEEYELVTQTIQKNIVELVNQYPDVEFLIFYTPYSICYWDSLNLEGGIYRQIEAERVATEMLLQCPNVKLYNFFDQYDIICNTDLYSDGGHYCAEVNSLILGWIAEDKGLVTKENYRERLLDESNFYMNFDYDSVYSELENEG